MIFDFFIYTVFPFIFVLSLIVFIHELGHYLVARLLGVRVEVFSIGFGPHLYGWVDGNDTLWQICCVPLGGYVKFLGDETAASTPDSEALQKMDKETLAQSFEAQPLWGKSLIVVAGPVANFILAIFIYTCIYASQERLHIVPIIGTVLEESAADKAGILANDKIIRINGDEFTNFANIRNYTYLSADEPLEIVILRGGREHVFSVSPRLVEQEDQFGNEFTAPQLGISPNTSEENISYYRINTREAFGKAVYQTWFVVKLTLYFIKDLFLGKQDSKELRGPIGIGQITTQFATQGFLQVIALAAVLSISIGLLNLFPIPMLDGGHLLFYGVSAVMGRPLPDKFLNLAYKFGFFLLIVFMIYVTSNDILRLFY